MEEESTSMIEDIETNVPQPEASVCTSHIHARSAFKGVVPQPNGHWGAQIYANHQRIWLGTFTSEMDAAMAYDSASLKLRTGDNHRNFPWTNINIHERKFQTFHGTEAILTMIRDGSYAPQFADFVRSQSVDHAAVVSLNRMHGHGGLCSKLLFKKELTPSDVGKLNRLVIPKKYAVKYFLPIPATTDQENMNEYWRRDEVHLFFYDRMMKLWKFRYCYWRSSQSFVFTRGWNRFVKENSLKANDTVAFYTCEGRDSEKERRPFWVIDVVHTRGSGNTPIVDEMIQLDLRQRLGRNCNGGLVKEDEEEFEGQKELTALGTTQNGKISFRLFGVEINSS